MPSFRIRRFVASDVFEPVSLRSVDLDAQESCPCCTARLTTCAVLRDASSGSRMRVGVCPSCGYTGYQDRPSPEWFSSFYDSRWDTRHAVDPARVRRFGASALVEMARQIGIPTDANVFEAGTGYGQLLRQFRDAGYTHLFGIEHSPHRAVAAARFGDARVAHGRFGDPVTTADLQKNGPYGLLYSKSVLEHVYEPGAFMRAARDIVTTGGSVLIAVPNVQREPVMTTLLFLPHLHAFTPQALETLARRYGFVPREVREVGRGLILVAEAGHAAVPAPAPGTDWPVRMVERWERALRVRHVGMDPVLYWWSVKDHERTGVLPGLRGRTAAAVFRRAPTVFRRVLFGIDRRSAAVSVQQCPGDDAVPLTLVLPELSLLVK